MAQRLVVDCDVHSARDETAPGVAYDLVVRRQGSAFSFLTVDLCDVCDKPLVELLAELAEVGRSFDDGSAVELRSAVQQPRKRAASAAKLVGANGTPKVAPQLDGAVPTPTSSYQLLPKSQQTACPACDYIGATRGALRKHVRAQHDARLSELDSGAAPVSTTPRRDALTCPECGYEAGAPQGLGSHRFRAHGVKGSSDSAKAQKAAKAAAKGAAHADE